MNMTMREMLPTERIYTYDQSSQLRGQTNNIGYLRGDFAKGGDEFHSSWTDRVARCKTDAFKAEFDDVINALREDPEYGELFKDRASMKAYCNAHPASSFVGRYCKEYGFRVDTEKYSYLIRCNPGMGDYDFYCHCFEREWLDHHMEQAGRGIRFIDSSYKELFRIADADQIRITDSKGGQREYQCRYIDDYHLEVGNNLYHICEFAERMEQAGSKAIPLRQSLPENCFSTLPSTGELILIKRGEDGYFHSESTTEDKEYNREFANDRNRNLGVSKAQEVAMLAGSMYGWEVPAADPKAYDENGILKGGRRNEDRDR